MRECISSDLLFQSCELNLDFFVQVKLSLVDLNV